MPLVCPRGLRVQRGWRQRRGVQPGSMWHKDSWHIVWLETHLPSCLGCRMVATCLWVWFSSAYCVSPLTLRRMTTLSGKLLSRASWWMCVRTGMPWIIFWLGGHKFQLPLATSLSAPWDDYDEVILFHRTGEWYSWLFVNERNWGIYLLL